MGFLRNPEIKRLLAGMVGICALATLAGFWLGTASGLVALGLSVGLGTLMLVATWRRYRAIAQLSRGIDRVLHGGKTLDIGDSAEGELAILKSEVYKLTVALREQADQLRSDKLYLTDSIADISHQLRTPLTSMNLVVSLMQKDTGDKARQLELTREMRALLSRMDWLIATLLKMSKIDAGTIRFQQDAVQVRQAIDRAAEPLVLPMELHAIGFTVQGDQAVFKGDMAWTVEALGNILKNCMEHTPEGGEIAVQYSENGLYTQIQISDTGSGIDPEDLPHIFERFYRGKNASPNSVGIGLALSRMIISAQNGTIKVGNRPEGGSRFIIRFYKGAV
nr:HAMP domain-containing sensor histidine kinase [bacterium]